MFSTWETGEGDRGNEKDRAMENNGVDGGENKLFINQKTF